MIVQFYGITFDLPAGWKDITEDLPEGSPPTLGRESGVGAVQFSIAKYHSGERPNAEFNDLRLFIVDFCQNSQIEINKISEFRSKFTMIVNILTINIEQTTSIFYLSDGKDFALVTYVAQSGENNDIARELAETMEIASSISF